MKLHTALVAFILGLTALPAPASAQTAPQAGDASASAPLRFVTDHEGTFNGQRVRYTATVDETVIRGDQVVPAVRFVTTAYVRQGGTNAARRPVVFLFNGGPSTSSAWLHMGGFGPRRISAPQDVAAQVPQPYQAVDNVHSLLDVADLVFIDPAETGFSRVLPGGDRSAVYTANGDAESVARFVETWLTANGREESPRYLIAESYGTIRAALMAGLLSERAPLDGVILFGQAVNIVETTQRVGNALSYATNLPTLAAIAAWHGRAQIGEGGIRSVVDDAWAFAMGDYLQALHRRADLSDAERLAIAERLEAFTGVGADYYMAHDLIISKVDFRKELLRSEGLVIGVYDARYTGPAPAAGQRSPDPFNKVAAMVPALLAEHFTRELGVTLSMADYRDSAPGTDAWGWSPTGGMGGPFSDFDYAGQIRRAMKANPDFRMMIGTGRFDTTTTIGPARYVALQMEEAEGRITLQEYDGGHMAYTNEEALKAMSDDVRAFIAAGR
jgi:carboxypeptidase C (cathepsin A)